MAKKKKAPSRANVKEPVKQAVVKQSSFTAKNKPSQGRKPLPVPVMTDIAPAIPPLTVPEAAIFYAEHGHTVFPAPPGEKKSHKSKKHSNGVNWGATSDPALIRQDFVIKWPGANIGLPTGSSTGFFVVEADTLAGHDVDGVANLAALQAQHGPLPPTRTARSPSGSTHYYFKNPPGVVIKNSASLVAPGVDVRGEGGMVIAPPSIKPGKGQYEWTNWCEISEAPDWLIELAKEKPRQNTAGVRAVNEQPVDPINLLAAITALPNDDLGWEDWNRIAMAIYAAFKGSDAGYAAFKAWSCKSAKYDEAGTEEKWAKLHECPPDQIGAGTLFYEADQAAPGWRGADPDDGLTTEQRAEVIRLAALSVVDYEQQRKIAAKALGVRATVLDTLVERARPRPQNARHMSGVREEDDPDALPEGATMDDFYSHLPTHSYIFVPTRALWPIGAINACLEWIPQLDANGEQVVNRLGNPVFIKPSTHLDQNRPVQQMSWAPGEPLVIKDRLVAEGGWIERPGATCFNIYRPPTIVHGDADDVAPWLDHIKKVYPNDVDHILDWCAHRKQRPQEKINHALFLGGEQGIGKDTILEPVKRAIGPWNFMEVTPQDMTERFNGYLKSIILRVSEARDLGEVNRYSFYEHMKTYTASPPDVHRVNEKNLKEHYIMNCNGVVITSNHKTDGIYLPPDDRRNYIAWSECKREDFDDAYWNTLWGWYESGGDRNVAAYLERRDISKFNPKAPPPKTEAFWAIVNSNVAPEESELADVLDDLGNPKAVTISQIAAKANPMSNFKGWIDDRKNRRIIPHKLERCDYAAVRNPDAKDGMWVIDKVRQVIYAKRELAIAEQIVAAQALIEATVQAREAAKAAAETAAARRR